MSKTIIHTKTLAAMAAFMLLFAAALFSQETSGETVRESAEMSIVFEDTDTTLSTDTAGSGNTDSVWVLVRVVLVLLIVCCGIYGIIYLLKKSTGISAAQDPFIRVVAQLPLAPGKTVQVLTVGSQAFLIGLSDKGIEHLADITDKELIDTMNLESDRNSAEPVPAFSALISRFMPARTANTPEGKNDSGRTANEPLSAGETADFIRRQRERLGKTGSGNNDIEQTGRFDQ